ncbi:multidrug and toxin extrusion protein 2 isoform X1 [Pipistrellus kuhlii]|uniref:multidrug and toxin extrusion protein 2 isoform X1 n=1 Tax=Pipistrellus kuhlii TaxID=59472 RepID=UPI001E2707AD|nr:multidrug and toxin extrusion protein 2 isoform X1 [Pipistrellus kuhlii]
MDSLRDAGPRQRGGCCPAPCQLVPVGFRAEAWRLLVLSGPLLLFQMLSFMIYVVSSVFCGHLGKVELASVTLSVAFVNVCGVSVGLGVSSACDTLMSQSFGSPNKKHVGVILQRGTLILLLCCFPCWALFLNTQHILLLLRQDPAVSRLTHEYVLIFMPALPVIFLYNLLAKYLQNQGIVWPQVLSGLVGNGINALANYVLVSVLSLGVRGSAFANTLSQFAQTVFLLLHITLRRLHRDTWAGWSVQCLQDWGPFFSLALPSMLMICIEWWAYEIGSFLMGLLSMVDLSAQAVIYEVATVTYMGAFLATQGLLNIHFLIPMGLSISVCVRVGTSLGAADTVQAQRSAASGVLCTVGTSLAIGALLSLLKNHLGSVFTSDEEVIALVDKVLPVYIIFQLFEALCCVYGGVLRGTGRQAFGAVVNAIAYYVVGLPLGIVLAFVVRLRTMGLWLGMLTCGVLAAAALAAYTARLDWARAAAEAEKYAGLPRRQGSQHPESGRPGAGPQEGAVSAVATGACPGVSLTKFSGPGRPADLRADLGADLQPAAPARPAPARGLSARQLAVRRGAALGAASAALAAGLAVSVLASRR